MSATSPPPTGPAGWYPDPAGSGRQRYFDGVNWTDSFAQTYMTVFSAPPPPTPTADAPKPAGWYPDPQGSHRRRYWDGSKWTDELTEPEIPGGKFPTRAMIIIGVAVVLWFAALAAEREGSAVFGAALFGLSVFGLIAWGVWLAFRSDARRKQRQLIKDHNRALAINAEAEHAAYMRGDDERGIYGQFPPVEPPNPDPENR